MNRIISLSRLVTVATLSSLLTLPFLLGAEERTTNNTRVENTTTITAERSDPRPDNERSTINLCDGVTCADGSCAATAAECAVEATISSDAYIGGDQDRPERRSNDTDGDRMPNTRDTDDAGDIIPIREQTRNTDRLNEAEGVLRRVVEDEIDEEEDVVAPAQDYNSTRSNRRKNVFGGWPDNDGDGWPEATLRAGAFIKIGSIEGEVAASANIDERVVCWGRAENADGTVYIWGRGLCVVPEIIVNDAGLASDRIAALQVRGDNVRAWSETERASWQEYLNNSGNISREERLAEHLIVKIESDNRIKEIRTDDAGAEMHYRAEMRLLGIIPIERNVKARVNIEGEVEIDYPWYSFLTTKPHREAMLNVLLDTVDILIRVPNTSN